MVQFYIHEYSRYKTGIICEYSRIYTMNMLELFYNIHELFIIMKAGNLVDTLIFFFYAKTCTTTKTSMLGTFQCRHVLLLWHMVGPGPAVLAAGAGRVGWFFFFFFVHLVYPIFLF